jgi:hypothetical protein
LRKIGKNDESATDSNGADEPKAKLGRQTIEDGWLVSNRDAVLNMFAFNWPEIGWQLSTAETREELRLAVRPLQDYPNRQYIDRLLRQTCGRGDEHEIRTIRLSLGDDVKQMHRAQSHCSECLNRCREIENAMIQARADQCEILLNEFSKRRTQCQAAQDRSRIATKEQLRRENQLLDEEAAYAQDELLAFILKGKYGFHPLNLANAVAGLPFAIGVPFMGAWQSHARCSKIKAPGWPHHTYQVFKIIESGWKDASSSTQAMIDVFEEKIRALPKRVIHEHPQLGRRKVENYARQFLCENWFHLQRAINKSLETQDDPRPTFFVIASNLNKFVGEPKTQADSAVAETARIRD